MGGGSRASVTMLLLFPVVYPFPLVLCHSAVYPKQNIYVYEKGETKREK